MSDAETVERHLHDDWSPDARVASKLGGNRSSVWLVYMAGKRYAARLSSRSGPGLDWEIELLAFVREEGFRVPGVVRTNDGKTRAGGLMVFEWMEGHEPSTEREWRSVVDELTRLHGLTGTWPQRPGFRSSQQLLRESRGGDVDLDRMPADAVERIREAWRAIGDQRASVVHGDVAAANVFIDGGRAGFVDWDEARVDASVFDLAGLPIDLEPLLGRDTSVRARRAAVAWEVANGWVAEPDYARRRLAELEAL